MSQVKNLRAMFENKTDSGPPDRGRSPGVSTSTSDPAGPNGTASPRPLSKVRTNFIAVERDGRMGFRRDHSGESSVSRRRASIETDAESWSTFPEIPATATVDDFTKPMSRLLVSEPPPECSRQSLAVDPSPSDAGTVSDKPSANPNKHLDNEQCSVTLAPADSAPTSPADGAKPKQMAPVTSGRGPKEDDGLVDVSAAPPRQLETTHSKRNDTRTTRTIIKIPSAAKTLKEAPNKANGKPTKISERPGAKRMTTIANRPQQLKGADYGDAGFVKPKPRSPTKPLNLPSSLTAPTTSSISKSGAPKQPGSSQRPSAHSHSSTKASLSAPTPRIKWKGSVASRPKPEVYSSQLGASTAKRQGHMDESFLERMTRPTRSSSSKTTEKGPLKPPRITTARSSTAGADNHRLPVAGDRKQAVSKTSAALKKPRASSQELEQRWTPAHAVNELARAETVGAAASSTQDTAAVRLPMLPGNLEPALGSDPMNAVISELTQAEAVERAAGVAQESGIAQAPMEPREAVAPEDIVLETAHVEAAKEAVAPAKDADLAPAFVNPETTKPCLGSTPDDQPAPAATHTDASDGKAERRRHTKSIDSSHVFPEVTVPHDTSDSPEE